ncbi:unnamed protein product [Auanema sp. JU1783]|nr:unnamed protein product [Auanema sp. JU1783]
MVDFCSDVNFANVVDVPDYSIEELTPFVLAEWIRTFYETKWIFSTNGAIGTIQSGFLFLTPANIAGNNIEKDTNFVYDVTTKDLLFEPANSQLTPCATVIAYLLQLTRCSTVIHTCSEASIEVTRMQEGNFVLQVSGNECIKGVWDFYKNAHYVINDTLCIPIIENERNEEELLKSLKTLFEYPIPSCAVLIRGRGLYVWGPSWELAKTSCENIENILEEEFLTLSLIL